MVVKRKAVSLQRLKEAGVAKLVDALDLGSSAVRRGGSSPFARTNQEKWTDIFCSFFIYALYKGFLIISTFDFLFFYFCTTWTIGCFSS